MNTGPCQALSCGDRGWPERPPPMCLSIVVSGRQLSLRLPWVPIAQCCPLFWVSPCLCVSMSLILSVTLLYPQPLSLPQVAPDFPSESHQFHQLLTSSPSPLWVPSAQSPFFSPSLVLPLVPSLAPSLVPSASHQFSQDTRLSFAVS